MTLQMDHHKSLQLQATVRNIVPKIRKEEMDFFVSGLSYQSLNSKQFLIQSDQTPNNVAFVNKALLRMFYIDQQGNEINTHFMPENDWATEYLSFITQSSKHTIQVLEPCELVLLTYKHMQSCYNSYPVFERLGRLIAEEVIKMLQGRIESLLFISPADRYTNFMFQFPHLYNRISLTMLSSYLGIERPSLSRIRKRLVAKIVCNLGDRYQLKT